MNAHRLGERIARTVLRRPAPPGPTCERCGKAPAHWPSYCERVYCADCYAIVLREPVQQ